MNSRLFPLVLAAATCIDPATAQTIDTLPPVRVTGHRDTPIPQPSAALTGPRLYSQRTATSDTAGLLQDVPGVSLGSAGGLSSLPIVRGLGDDRPRIII